MFENDKGLLGEFLLIVGGFVFAETIVRTFIDMANKVHIDWWVLPALSVLIFINGFQLKKGIKEKWISSWIYDFFIIFEVIFLVLLLNGKLSHLFFTLFTLAGVIITPLIWIIESKFKKPIKNKGEQKSKAKLKDKVVTSSVKKEISIEKNDNELLKLAIITLLITAMFGVLQYFPDGKTFDSVGMGLASRVIASTMFGVILPIFIFYLLFLGLDSRFKKKLDLSKAKAFFYDLGVYLTAVIIFFAILLCFLINLLVAFPNFPMSFVLIIIGIFALVASFLGWKSLMMHFNNKE